MIERTIGFLSTNAVIALSLLGAAVAGYAYVSVPLGEELIDVLRKYDLPVLIERMEAYDTQGRARYFKAVLALDTLFVICYVTFMVGLFSRLAPLRSIPALALLPLATGLFDLAENGQIAVMLRQFPDLSSTQVEIASLCTQGKHGLSQICMALILVSLTVTSLQRIRRKLRSESSVE